MDRASEALLGRLKKASLSASFFSFQFFLELGVSIASRPEKQVCIFMPTSGVAITWMREMTSENRRLSAGSPASESPC